MSKNIRLAVAPGRWRLWLDETFHIPQTHRAWQPLHAGPHSRIYAVDSRTRCIAKLAMPRSLPRDALRKYVLCQARREYRGNRTLTALGLRAPAVFGWGVSLNPTAEFESVLFMEQLPAFVSGLNIIRQERHTERRLEFLRRLAEQLGLFHGQGYVHKDLHFDNLCVLADHTIAWIDNDIRRPRTQSGCRRGLVKTLTLLKTTARGTIADGEWHQFNQALRSSLLKTPHGERLLDEIS